MSLSSTTALSPFVAYSLRLSSATQKRVKDKLIVEASRVNTFRKRSRLFGIASLSAIEAAKLSLGERILALELLLSETHERQRQDEVADAARLARRNASAARRVHVVISIIDNKVPDFAYHAAVERADPRVKLIVYNKTTALNTSAAPHIDAHGHEHRDVPFTSHTRNCASYVEYVAAHYERLPDVAIMLKTNSVSTKTASIMIETALRNQHDVDSHWWPPWQARTLIFVRCNPRWAWSPLYHRLCPCSDVSLQWQVSRKEQIFHCLDAAAAAAPLSSRTTRSGRPRPLVEEVFSEGLFAFSRAALYQQPRTFYTDWAREMAERGENHQYCLDEWITMFDEAGDAPWGRDNTSNVPVWKASPSRLIYRQTLP